MIYVWDIETLSNCFTCVFIDVSTKEKFEFVIHKSRNDYKQFKEFFLSCKGLIGFNSVGFDYPVVHDYINKNFDDWTGDALAKHIYKRAQRIINDEKREWIKPLVPQRDLYLIWHFNNKARSTSLKWLQFCIGWHNLQEMPIDHSTKVTDDMIPTILEYNTNDVETTLEFYNRSKSRIMLRKNLSEKYNVDMGNFADTRIGEEIFLQGISDKTGVNRKVLRDGRTHRTHIVVNECLVKNILFQTEGFQRIHDEYGQMVITDTKKNSQMVCTLDGVTYEFGFGGLHGFRESKVYRDVISADVSSYYPNLAISLGLHPRHLGQAFCDVYKQLYEDRKKYPKGSDENAAIKLALNGVFGQSNAEWSPFYDPQLTMSITLNGQLLLALLCERITVSEAGNIIMANTDGIEVQVIDDGKFKSVCKEWEDEYSLSLEFAKYRTLAARDCNNYIAVYEDGKTKEKGAYECTKELYKDQSMKIVPIAVREYFTKGTPIHKTIQECKDISLFMMGIRAKTGSLEFRRAVDTTLHEEKLPKTVRYYVSNSGGSIVKVTEQKKKQKKDYVISPNQLGMFDVKPLTGDEREEKITNIHVGRRMTIFNKWITKPFEEYDLDLHFYQNEAQKLINAVTNNQTTICS